MFSMFSLGLHVLPQGLYFAPPFICLIFSPAPSRQRTDGIKRNIDSVSEPVGGSIKTGLEEEVDLWAMNRRGGLHPNPTYVWTRAHKSPKPSGWFLAVPHNRPPMPFLRPPCPTADESHECRPGLQAAMEEPDWNHDQPRRLPNVENLIILGFKSTQITFVVWSWAKCGWQWSNR